VATEGMGVAPIVDSVALTGQTADIGATNFTNAGIAGMYRITIYYGCSVADATAGTFTPRFDYTDFNGANYTLFSAVQLTSTNSGYSTKVVQLSSGNITYSTSHTGNYGTSAYNLYITVERLQ
jgi:hypothetical protein